MFVVDSLATAILFCVITMIGWGSWANTQKLAGRARWPFELFYWDYALGVFASSVVFLHTLGNTGSTGMGAVENLHQAAVGALMTALFSGVLFNISNILLVVSIDSAGMSIAFPIGVGLALVIGTVKSFLQTPKGSAILLFSGVALIIYAMIMSALAYRRLPARTPGSWTKGVGFAVVAGSLMGLFYPQLMRSISPDFNSAPIRAGMLTPYNALFFFAVGVVLSNVAVNTVFMRASGHSYAEYFRGTARLHLIGMLGGAIWMLALSLNVLASGVAGPAIASALGQGATLVAAVWGVFVWKEFRDAPPGTQPLIALMFVGYAAGLVVIGFAA